MIKDLKISYVCDGIETTRTVKDGCYDNMPYNLSAMFGKVIMESGVNPNMVFEK